MTYDRDHILSIVVQMRELREYLRAVVEDQEGKIFQAHQEKFRRWVNCLASKEALLPESGSDADKTLKETVNCELALSRHYLKKAVEMAEYKTCKTVQAKWRDNIWYTAKYIGLSTAKDHNIGTLLHRVQFLDGPASDPSRGTFCVKGERITKGKIQVSDKDCNVNEDIAAADSGAGSPDPTVTMMRGLWNCDQRLSNHEREMARLRNKLSDVGTEKKTPCTDKVFADIDAELDIIRDNLNKSEFNRRRRRKKANTNGASERR